MKKIIFCITLLFTLFCFITGEAQTIPSYTFSQSNSNAYNAITSGTVLGSGSGLTNERYAVSLPFAFNLDNASYTNIYVAVNGFISFGTTNPGSGYWMIQSSSAGFKVVSGFDAQLGGLNAGTELSYQTIGTSPNRTFIAQWKDFGYQGATALIANFQIHLHESTNEIEIHYGNTNLGLSSNLSVQVGLRGSNNGVFLHRRSTNSDWLATSNATSPTHNILYTAGNNPPSTLKYTFTPPPNCTPPDTISNLAFNSNTSSISPSWSAPVSGADKYLVVRTPNNTTLNTNPVDGQTYATSSSLGNGMVVYNGSNTSFNNTGLVQSTYYTYTVFSYNDLACSNGPAYSQQSIFSTYSTTGPRKYYWNAPGGVGDFSVATNWSPARTSNNILDTLIINSGNSATVNNFSSQQISQLVIKDQTEVRLSSNGGTDNLTLQNDLSIEQGSMLTLTSPGIIQIKFNTFGALATIDGTLDLEGSSNYDAYRSNTLVSGVVKVTNNAQLYVTNNQPNAITFLPNSYYYHSRNGGFIPRAHYSSSSTIMYDSISNSIPTLNIGNSKLSIGNFIVNCPMSGTIIRIDSWADSVKGLVKILKTGSGSVFLKGLRLQNDVVVETGEMEIEKSFLFGNLIVDSASVTVDSLACYGDISTTAKTIEFDISGAGDHRGLFFVGYQKQYININPSFFYPNYTIILDNPAGVELDGIIPLNKWGRCLIKRGNYSGSGRFAYIDEDANLFYDLVDNYRASAVEWPDTLSPTTIRIFNSSMSPKNRLHMPGSRTIDYTGIGTYPIAGTAVLVLDTCDLLLDKYGYNNFQNVDSLNIKIATNGTGQLLHRFPAMSNTATFSNRFVIGDISGNNIFSTFDLRLLGDTVDRVLGFKLVNQKHPADTAANFYSRYWEITDDRPSVPVNYNLQVDMDDSEWSITPGSKLKHLAGGVWKNYPSSQGGATVYTNVVNSAIYSLAGSAITGSDSNHGSYVNYYWTGLVSSDYQNPMNWTPVRNNVSTNDILHFNNGTQDSVTNFFQETISGFRVYNNTQVKFYSQQTMVTELYIKSDNNTNVEEFFIEGGSSLSLIGLSEFKLWGTDVQASIHGVFDNVCDVLELGSSTMTVYPTGVLISHHNGQPNFVSSNSSLIVFGRYESRVAQYANAVPYGTWKDGSVVAFTQVANTNSSQVDMGLGQSFYDIEINCPTLTGTWDWDHNRIDTVRNEMRIISTGSGVIWPCDNWTFGEVTLIRKLNISGGSIDMRGTHHPEWVILDTLIQTGGTLYSSVHDFTLHFAGNHPSALLQCKDASFSGEWIYKISNPNGIQLVGTGTLNSQPFHINDEGGVIVNTPNSAPIQTNLILSYDSTESFLRYTYPVDQIMDTICFPSTGSPVDLTVDIGDHVLEMSFDAQIAGKLFVLGDSKFDIGLNHLTIGRSVNMQGLIVGKISTQGGILTKWCTTTALFPFLYNGKDESLKISSNGILSGGTLSVQFNPTNGSISNLSLIDGMDTITNRTNFNWDINSGNGFMFSGTADIEVVHGGQPTFQNNMDLRLVHTNALVGSHVAGSGNYPLSIIRRGSLTMSQLLTDSFFVGYNSSNLSNVFVSVQSGLWNNPATWNKNTVPTALDDVYISSNDTVRVQGSSNAQFLSVVPDGVLEIYSDTMSVINHIEMNGSFLVRGGTVILGPSGGGNKSFNNLGTFRIDSGLVYINGNFEHNSSDSMYQTGGMIVIDPLNTITNVSSNKSTFKSNYLLSFKGGVLRIVDPPQSNNIKSIDLPAITGYKQNIKPEHIIELGDSLSIETNNSNFNIDQGATSAGFGSLIINTPIINGFRKVKVLRNTVFRGSIRLKYPTATFENVNHQLSVAGDIWLDSATHFVQAGNLYLAKYFNQPSLTKQTIGGQGIFSNTIGTSSNNFDILIVNNASPDGVRFEMGSCRLKGISLIKGAVHMGLDTMIQTEPYAIVPDSGWVDGLFSANIVNSSSSIVLPIGDSLRSHFIEFPMGLNQVAQPGYLIASGKNVDHPLLATTLLNPAKSANVHYSLSKSNGLQFQGGPVEMKFNWHPSRLDPVVSLSNFYAAHRKNSMWNYHLPINYGPTYVRLYQDFDKVDGEFAFAENNQPISTFISVQPMNQNACVGDIPQFIIQASPASSYQWQVNFGSGWISLSNNSVYSGTHAPILSITNATLSLNTNQYRCIVYGLMDSIVSNSATLFINASITPSVSITVSPMGATCQGQAVQFSATPNNAGVTPLYKWSVNGQPALSGNAQFQTNMLNHGDTVVCELVSSSSCASPANVFSNEIVMTINPNLTPSITISSATSDTICTGTSKTFTAAIQNGGSAPVYTWKKNGTIVGTNSGTYTTSSLTNNDTITCELLSNYTCTTSPTALSNQKVITVLPVLTPTVSISVSPGDTICMGDTAFFQSSIQNGGNSPQYQWYKNNTAVGTNTVNYSDNNLVNGDIIKVELISSYACLSQNADTSNTISMTVNSLNTPSVSISVSPNDTICIGTMTSFTSSVVNAGPTVTYDWRLNGNNVSNTMNYSSNALAQGDIVELIIQTTPTCPTTTIDTSNAISMTVNQLITPSVSISVTPSSSLCNGDTAIYSASISGGGTAPQYQWYKNNNLVGTNSSIYQDANPATNDTVYCILVSSEPCVVQNNDTSNKIGIQVNPINIASIAITASPGTSICSGTAVTFTANATNQGSAPAYQWQLNSTNVGSNSSTYTGSTFNNNDVISCQLTSSTVCTQPATVQSNNITLAVLPATTPSVSISANPGNTINAGQLVIFTATPTNGGLNPSYQWKLNGTNVGTNSTTYQSSTLQTGDVIEVEMTSSDSCATIQTVKSSNITMTVSTSVSSIEGFDGKILVYPNPTTGTLSISVEKAKLGNQPVELTLVTPTGQTVLKKSIETSQSSKIWYFELPKYLTNGIYVIKLNQKNREERFMINLMR